MIQPSLSARSQVVIIDRLGLHMQPATKLVTLARSFRSDIRVIAKQTTADGKSLLELLVLAIEYGTTLDFVAHGPDAEEAVAALIKSLGAGPGGAVIQEAVAA
jgi:phosphotransferase system HPr (HPr) family protein